MALESAPLIWFDNILKRSIDTLDKLKQLFIANYQGTYDHQGTRHDLSMCRQKESLWEYMRCYFEMRAMVTDISEHDVIDLFQTGLYSRQFDTHFGCNCPKTVQALCTMIEAWADQEECEIAKYGNWRNNDWCGNNDHRGNDFKGQHDFKGFFFE
ncbi:unnamed protein product [Urochloa humidicola]